MSNIVTANIIYNKSSQSLGYTDDLDVIERKTSDAKDLFLAIERKAISVTFKRKLSC